MFESPQTGTPAEVAAAAQAGAATDSPGGNDASRSGQRALPMLSRDPSFWGMTVTQFLGAFNDNLFKQLILLVCVDYAIRSQASGDIYQTIAQALFALPFVMLSGFAGWLSDRTGKRSIVVLCKIGEIAVMLAGLWAFLLGGLNLLFLVLFCMGAQSAFFGPSKYGILPEMLREGDLPAANGTIQMTTFLAIIFGTAAAGYLKEWYPGQLWIVAAWCVAVATLGTLTALLVRKTPIAHPGLPFRLGSLGMTRETRTMLRQDGTLTGVLLISSLFWFIGGVVMPAVNAFGKAQMGLADGRTSLLATCMGVGIAVGCVIAGKLSRHRVRFGLVTLGAWGIVLCFAGLASLGLLVANDGLDPQDAPPAVEQSAGEIEVQQVAAPEPFVSMLIPQSGTELLARLGLTLLGLFSGMFVVPLQVFMQARPPADQKGRMIGAMNLVNWIGILLSAGFYFGCSAVLDRAGLPISWTFAATGALLLPVALWYRPEEPTPADSQA